MFGNKLEFRSIEGDAKALGHEMHRAEHKIYHCRVCGKEMSQAHEYSKGVCDRCRR
jgi:hypothetical protein